MRSLTEPALGALGLLAIGWLAACTPTANVGQCDTIDDCFGDEICHQGYCRQTCNSRSDCEDDLSCVDGVCLPHASAHDAAVDATALDTAGMDQHPVDGGGGEGGGAADRWAPDLWAGADMTGQDLSPPDRTAPDTRQPDAAQPDTQQPDTQQLDTRQPDTWAPDSQRPDMWQPDTCVIQCQGKCAGAANGCGGTCPVNDCLGCCSGQHVCYPYAQQGDTVCGASGTTCQNCAYYGQVCAAATHSCCTPQCEGRCGGVADGCGGFCSGTCSNGYTCSAQGYCVCNGTECSGSCCSSQQVCLHGSCCPMRWQTDLSGAGLSDVRVAADGAIYASGSRSSQAYVAKLDACGTLLDDVVYTLSGSTSSSNSALVLSGSVLYTVGQYAQDGNDPGNGMWSRVSPATLDVSWSWGLQGAATQADEVWSVAVAPDGYLWMSGTVNVTSGPYHAWVIKAKEGEGACGWDPFSYSNAVGRDVVVSGGRVYVTGALAGEAVVTSWAYTEASTTFPCFTEPTGALVTFGPVGEGIFSEMRGLAVSSGTLYTAGFTSTNGDLAGLVARVVDTAATLSSAWNPTAQGDGYTDAALSGDGASLYVVGLTAWDGTWQAGTAGTAVLRRYATSTLAATWTAYLDDFVFCRGVAVDAAGGLVLACSTPSSAAVLRCTADGVCP